MLTPLHTAPGQAPLSHPDYRPDIDGLRAIAVLSVIAFHLDMRLFRGGFVGVDVFFVISGYLISQIIFNEVRHESFSLARFYERRVRRILPALYVMLAVMMVVGCILLLPNALNALARGTLAAVASVSNFYFLATSDYFSALSARHLLLHTWSLGVEEQFYVFFPPFVMLVHRFAPRRLDAACVIAALLSFAWSAATLESDPTATFYQPGTRAWEMLLGTLLALDLVPPPTRRWIREAAGMLGAAMIGGAILFFSSRTPFPGPWALIPCVGTALLLHSGARGDTLVSRCLSIKPAVFVGLISYSLYLWHWPLLVLLNRNLMPLWPGGPVGKLAALAIMLLIATASWRYVERPFRSGNLRISRLAIFTCGAGASAVLALCAIPLILSDGWSARLAPKLAQIAGFEGNRDSNEFRRGTCFITSSHSYSDYRRDLCLSPSNDMPNVLVLGDSHAAHLWSALARTLDANVMQATAAGCKPTRPQLAYADPGCTRMVDDYFDGRLVEPDLLVLAARWKNNDVERISATLDLLRSHNTRVLLVGPVVEYRSSLPVLLVRAAQSGSTAELDGARMMENAALDQRLEALAKAKGAAYASPYRAICPGKTCITQTREGVPLQFDQSHFTGPGAQLVVRKLIEQGAFGPIPARRR